MNYANMTEEEYFSIVIKRLIRYMQKNGVKQLDLSRQTNISQSTLSKILSGETKLTLSSIFKICNALSIDPEILLSFDHEIATDTLHQKDTGIINRTYINDEILIRNSNHAAFKGYIGHAFHIYLYSTISSESSLLLGKISFEDTEYHNFCKATMELSTGKKDSNNNNITKKYYGELIISLTMGACYCILVNPEIGEVCTINFKHTFLFNQNLICRVGTVLSTSSGTNKLPIIQRALITDTALDVNNPDSPDFEFVRGQLRLNDSEIILSKKSFDNLTARINESSSELNTFLSKCTQAGSEYHESATYYVFDETKIRSINVSSDTKAEGISILRNLSTSPKYNKVSTKTEEFTFQFISEKK
ncbi:MAG: helix-turn-helix transcriptional regulator [Lachnospiraceae bacterium]|nr:helix-turn-helix transcriptional regulator [Lachnospiraceae bacterium]